MVDYSLVSKVRDDLQEIWHFIAKDTEVVRAAYTTFEQLAKNPGQGRPRTFGPRKLVDVRLYPVVRYSNYRVVYRETPGGKIEVLAVVHTARNLAALLRRR